MVIPDNNWAVNAEVINTVLQAAQALGAQRSPLLKKADIDPQWLKQMDYRVPVRHLFELYHAAEKATNNPDFALYSGRASYMSGLVLQLYMITACQTFRQYLNLIPSVLRLRGDIGEVKVRREGDLIRLAWCPLLADTCQQRYLTDDILTGSVALVSSLCVQPIFVIKAEFSYPKPRDLTMLQHIFGANLSFGHEQSCLYFEGSCLDFSIIQLEDELYEGIRGPVRRFFADSESVDSFLVDLRKTLARLLPLGDISIDRAAAQLNMSRRTLQRRLSDRDTQFLKILQDVRSELAVRYLGDKRLSITEIAFLLGYADQGSFSTAFKTWHGVSPSDYRQG